MKVEDILNECIERVMGGESIEACLARYPEHAPELEPLLRVAVATATASQVEPRPGFKAEARYRLQAALQKPRRRRFALLRGQPKWVGAVAGVLLLFLAGSGTVVASASSVPGDVLYPVKTATERVRMAFARGDEARAELEIAFAERRAQEIVVLSERGRVEKVDAVVDRLTTHLERVKVRDIEVDKKVDRLKALLEQGSARNVKLLEGVAERVPQPVRAVVTRAMKRSDRGYEKAMVAVGAPSIELSVSAKAVAPEKALGTIVVSNEGKRAAEVAWLRGSLQWESEGGLWHPLATRFKSFPALEPGTTIPAAQALQLSYEVLFIAPEQAKKLRHVVEVKIVDRERVFRQATDFEAYEGEAGQ